MGAVIAGECARAGCRVTLVDVNETTLETGIRAMVRAHEVLAAAGVCTQTACRKAQRNVRTTTELDDACRDVDILVEAVSEDMKLKRRLFKRFDRLCARRTVLASNTSGLSITKIAGATSRPTKVAGLHFWNPPHIVPLVEVTRGPRTSAVTARLLADFCRRLGKQPIIVQHDVPGFVGNRLQFAVMREALHLLEEGVASAEDIDRAMTAGPGLRYGLLGPLRTADLGGLDIFLAISRYLFGELHSGTEPPACLSKRVEHGEMGAKSGKGFYRYSVRDLPDILARRDRVLLGFLKVLAEEEK